MSQQLINRNPDLKRLWDEGYQIEIRSGHLLVSSVPYLNAQQKVRLGVLATPLGDMSGDTIRPPSDHTIYFVGEHPCDTDGKDIDQIKHSSGAITLFEGLVANHRFSAKPRPDGRYRDYHHKIVTYVSLITGPAQSVDQAATARTFAVVSPEPGESPFNYLDTASTRAGIAAITSKLAGQRIAIVGVGGTGSYVLDFVSKTPVEEIHIFDGDFFMNHNAFRAPGAPSLEDLRKRPTKVEYLGARYAQMHRGVRLHPYFIEQANVDELHGMDFVFVCMDRGLDRRLLVDHLLAWGRPFIDVGMGLAETDGSLRGQVRVTAVTGDRADHIAERVPFSGDDGENVYAHNIQIAELNALNAALAVIKWKKLCGHYQDIGREHHSVYTINGNALMNEDRA